MWLTACWMLPAGAAAECGTIPDGDVVPYHPADPPGAPGYWLSEMAGRCLLAEVGRCRAQLAISDDLSGDLLSAVTRQTERIEAMRRRWWEDPRLWFAAGVVAGGAAVVLGGYAVMAVAK